jgi:hypothetical protein
VSPPRSDDHGLLLRYDRVRSFAQNLQGRFKASPGGDEYVYRGSMNEVEVLRDALADLEGYMNANGIEVPDDTPGGEWEGEE